jgi:hypothetical protein
MHLDKCCYDKPIIKEESQLGAELNLEMQDEVKEQQADELVVCTTN